MENITLIFIRVRCCSNLQILLLIKFLLTGLLSMKLCLNVAVNVKFSGQENCEGNRLKGDKPIDKTTKEL